VILGTLLVLAGLAAALVTVLARRANESGVAGVAAIFSLVIALLLTIFIVPPLARSARVEVANLDFPIEPTSGGGVFLVIIVVVGFAAWNTGNNLLFLVFSLLLSTLFVGWVAARISLRDFTVVYPAAGARTASVQISPDRLAALTGASWIDVCHLPA